MHLKISKGKRAENISTIFLLPAIEIKESLKNKFIQQGFINTYTECNRLKYNYPIILVLFKPLEFNQNFYRFHSDLKKNKNYIETFDLGNNLTLLSFKIPDKFNNDYNLFIEGKYSQFSKEYQGLFPNSTFLTDSTGKLLKDKGGSYATEVSPFYHIFNKTEYLKNKWKEKFGYSKFDTIFDDIELYEKQDYIKERYITIVDL